MCWPALPGELTMLFQTPLQTPTLDHAEDEEDRMGRERGRREKTVWGFTSLFLGGHI